MSVMETDTVVSHTHTHTCSAATDLSLDDSEWDESFELVNGVTSASWDKLAAYVVETLLVELYFFSSSCLAISL
jgi:hypothetical protein